MITIQEAYKKARKEFSGRLQDCIELSSGWAFYFSDGDTPGSPYILVVRESGEIEHLYVPPMSNLKLLRSGTHINLKIFLDAL